MRLISSVTETRQLCRELVASRGELALVPTMGALHDGHLQLVREAGMRDLPVVVSIFVNPTQFGPEEDYERYPRSLDSDIGLLSSVPGVEAVFAPEVSEMYPDGIEAPTTVVAVRDLPDHLCGAFRPGHFDGVTTVVSKLFNICTPTVAFFGKKDAQQFVILRRMVKDLNFGIEIVGVETVRESDGLALSSRNKYLTNEARSQATVLYRAVNEARDLVMSGETRHDAVVDRMATLIREAPLARLQYAELVSAFSLKPAKEISRGDNLLAAVAVFFGTTRLIDNAFISVGE